MIKRNCEEEQEIVEEKKPLPDWAKATITAVIIIAVIVFLITIGSSGIN